VGRFGFVVSTGNANGAQVGIEKIAALQNRIQKKKEANQLLSVNLFQKEVSDVVKVDFKTVACTARLTAQHQAFFYLSVC